MKPALVEVAGDALQQGVAGDELLEAQPAAGVGHGLRDDQDADRVGAVLALLALQAGDTGRLGGRAPGQFLVVAQGHGPLLGAQRDRRPGLRLLDRLALDAAPGGLPVDDVGHVRHRAAQHLDGARATFPARPPPVR